MQIIDTDVLIIGGGGAGCRSAIECSKYQIETTIISRTILGKSGCTVMAEGGYNSSLANVDKEDNWKVHFKDTIEGGAYLNNQKLVEILVNECKERIYDLEEYGALFSRTEEGKIAQRAFGKQTYRRTCYAGDRTGHELMLTLLEEMRRKSIKILEEVMVTNLLKDGERVVGATAIDIKTGEFLLFKAKAIILATGGAGRIFKITSNSSQATGDGYAIAYRIGVELIDMEQFQFHPTGMVFPESSKGVLVTEAVRGEGGKLLNIKGERFLANYEETKKKMELSGRDEISRAIASEILKGNGTKNNAVLLSVQHLSKETIEKKLPTMLKQFLDVGVDIRNEPMEVAPTAHHFMGGIRINEKCETNIKGLFACGEVCGGVHGGNRLGGNALAETQVFGKIAGENAGKFALSNKKGKINIEEVKEEEQRIKSFFKENGVSPIKLINRLREVMWENVGIFRDENKLKNALNEVKKLEEDYKNIKVVNEKIYNKELVDALSLENMLLTAEIIINCALFRKESRGSHFRTDFNKTDNVNWLKNIVVKKENGSIRIFTENVVITTLNAIK